MADENVIENLGKFTTAELLYKRFKLFPQDLRKKSQIQVKTP